jgi:hypothetical protein
VSAIKYHNKMIRSGDIIELYTYENQVRTGKDAEREENNGRRGSSQHDWINEQEVKSKNRGDSLQKAKKRLRREINANMDEWVQESKFITLTYADNLTDLKESNANFNKFIKRLNYQLKIKLKYSCVVEFQKRGAIHYHLVTYNLPYIKNSELAEIWGHGFIKINKIEQVDNVGAYVTKYMSKDNDDERLKGQKCHFSSRGLIKPVEEVLEEKEKESLATALTDYEVFATDFKNDYLGTISYKQYNLKRNKK